MECPRDSWQGFARFIPTEEKVGYLLELLEAGFESLDLTSFVSPRWVPQHADAEAVLAALPAPQGREYLAIIGNPKGPAGRAPHRGGLPLLHLGDLPTQKPQPGD